MNQNQELIKKAKEILKKVQASGGEAFIIGETVYKLINGKTINNVYIYSTLSEVKFIEAFSAFKIKKINKKKFQLGYFGYNYIVTCDNQIIDRYRLAKTKTNSHYSRNIVNAICQNDYSIYAMAMNYNGIIYDMFQARDDIYKKKINSVFYKPQEVYKDMPSKMLDVIKLVSQTGYKLENKIIKAIKSRGKFIKKVDIEIVSKYLKLIIDGDYSKEQYEAFYQKTLEPIIKSLGQAFTKGLFTNRELGFNNEIKFYAKELIFMNTKQKIELFDILVDTGSCYKNEVRTAFGLKPLAELNGQIAMSSNLSNAENNKADNDNGGKDE